MSDTPNTDELLGEIGDSCHFWTYLDSDEYWSFIDVWSAKSRPNNRIQHLYGTGASRL